MEIIWHYTSGEHFKKIVQEKRLKVSESDRRMGIKPAIWFSKNEFWEPTASKSILKKGRIVQLSMKEQHELLGLVRIGVEFPNELISWAKFKYVGKINSHLHYLMELAGIQQGANPSDWYCAFRNVPSCEWVKVEKYDGNKWMPVNFELLSVYHNA